MAAPPSDPGGQDAIAAALSPMAEQSVVCSGCGAVVPDVPELRSDHLYVGAAAGCWAAYTELIGREMAEPRRFSEHTAQLIDEEVSRLLREAAEKATAMLTEHREKLDALARRLEEIETLDEAEIEKLIGPSVHKQSGAATEIASYRSKGTTS